MKSKIITMMLSTVLAVSIITGCENTTITINTSTDDKEASETAAGGESADSSASDSNEAQNADTAKGKSAASYEELIASLHAGQSYAYAPICEGEDALLVTSYAFDDLEGHQGTYEATIYIEKSGSVEKVTTVQSGGTAYPIAVTDDNSLILSKRNSVLKGYVNKETGKFIITEEANVNYSNDKNENYHNYKEGVAEVPADSSLYDELADKYLNSDVLSFTNAGVSSDGEPCLSGAVYAAYKGDDLYNVSCYYVFESENSGHTQTTDGLSGLPFTYELNGEDITFHFGSADDTSEARFGQDIPSYPTITFTKDNETIKISCLGNEDPETFDAVTYYDNDNNLYMDVKKFDETTLTGDLYRKEKIKAEYVDDAEDGSLIYSVNGTQFQVVSFEEVKKEIDYTTSVEQFKKDVIGTSRFDGFLVKCGDDDFYYALEKNGSDLEYDVVTMMNEGDLRKLIEENVTFRIKENCEISLNKFVDDGEFSNLEQEYIIGREFKGDNYPGWSADAKEYYLTDGMLVSIGVIDGELYNFSQVYLP